MPLYRPSELADLLKQMGASPKKRYSQNFLIDGNVIGKIVQLADVQPGDEVVEIGPGPGALTEALLQKGVRLLAIEKDPLWAEALNRLEGDLTVIQGDILTCSLESILKKWKTKEHVKLIANLPYHITTPILTRLAPHSDLFSSIVVMVQEEVARRFTSPPGSKEYGSITVFLNFFSHISYGFKVKRTSFYPAPNVDSAVIKLQLKPHPADIDPDAFFKMTRKAFEQRRKMLKGALKDLLSESVKESHKALLEKRAEALSLDQFLELFKACQKENNP